MIQTLAVENIRASDEWRWRSYNSAVLLQFYTDRHILFVLEKKHVPVIKAGIGAITPESEVMTYQRRIETSGALQKRLALKGEATDKVICHIESSPGKTLSGGFSPEFFPECIKKSPR